MHDPYFSIWSSCDQLYDADPVHWSGIRQKIRGYVTVDGMVYSFLGNKEFHTEIPQKAIDVTATKTVYTFENEKIILNVGFTSPLLLEDLTLVSRPCTYVDFTICLLYTSCESRPALQCSLNPGLSGESFAVRAVHGRKPGSQ